MELAVLFVRVEPTGELSMLGYNATGKKVVINGRWWHTCYVEGADEACAAAVAASSTVGARCRWETRTKFMGFAGGKGVAVLRVEVPAEVHFRALVARLRAVKGGVLVHEAGIDATTQFMMEAGVYPCSWHTVTGLVPVKDGAVYELSPGSTFSVLTDRELVPIPVKVAALSCVFAATTLVEATLCFEGEETRHFTATDERGLLTALHAELRCRVDVLIGHGLLRGGDLEKLGLAAKRAGCNEFYQWAASPARFGVICVDTQRLALAELRLRDNSLGSVCAAAGLVVDLALPPALLVWRLGAAWGVVPQLLAQARVMDVLPADNVHGGQDLRVRNTLMRAARRAGMVMNGVDERSLQQEPPSTAEDAVAAVGGWVLSPAVGLHKDPVVVMDFAALYPSVQLRENLCYSNVLVAGDTPAAWPGVEFKTYSTPTGEFYFAQGFPGVLPSVLRRFRAARAAYQKVVATTAPGSPDHVAALFSERAIKRLSNAIYGTANFAKGRMPCRALGTTTAHVGRQLNQRAAAFFQEALGAEIIYGDTDSVFMKPPAAHRGSVAAARSWAASAEAAVNAHLETGDGYIAVEFEKVYQPWLGLAKKTYAGLVFPPVASGPDVGEEEWRGGLAVRRDVPGFVAGHMRECVSRALLRAADWDAFYDEVDSTAELMCALVLPLDAYIHTVELGSRRAGQPLTPAHAVAAAAADGKQQYRVGDRVPFVVVDDVEASHLPPAARLARCAREPVLDKSPLEQNLDVVHYMGCLVSFLDQLTLHTDSEPERAHVRQLQEFAISWQARHRARRGCIRTLSGAAPAVPKLPHKRPVAAAAAAPAAAAAAAPARKRTLLEYMGGGAALSPALKP